MEKFIGEYENLTDSERNVFTYVFQNQEKVSVMKMVGKASPYEIELTGTKKQILKAIDWVAKNEEPMSVVSINLTFDNSTGKLSGTILVHFFSLNGNGKAYVEPDISGIILGNEDVFGTFKK